MRKNIFVYADWAELKKPAFMGTLFASYIRGKEVFSFEYNSQWLKIDSESILDRIYSIFQAPNIQKATNQILEYFWIHLQIGGDEFF